MCCMPPVACASAVKELAARQGIKADAITTEDLQQASKWAAANAEGLSIRAAAQFLAVHAE